MLSQLRIISLCLVCACVSANELLHPVFGDMPPHGNAVIHRKAGPSEIVITTTNRLAGAIDSLTWNGKEFIDSFDHGRQLQSAASFNFRATDPFWAERYNPIEAGSQSDGVGKTSSSKLLSLHAQGAELQTTSRMAF